MENLSNIVVSSLLIVIFVGWLTTVLIERSVLYHTRLTSYIVSICVLLTIAGLAGLLLFL